MMSEFAQLAKPVARDNAPSVTLVEFITNDPPDRTATKT